MNFVNLKFYQYITRRKTIYLILQKSNIYEYMNLFNSIYILICYIYMEQDLGIRSIRSICNVEEVHLGLD